MIQTCLLKLGRLEVWKLRNGLLSSILGFDVNCGILSFWIGLGKVLCLVGMIGPGLGRLRCVSIWF